MKKIKYCLVLILVTVVTFSCSKDKIETIEANEEIHVLEFDSNESLEKEMERVLELKSQKEISIIRNMFGENGLQIQDGITKRLNNKEINQEKLLKSIQSYHEEKLKAIYEERNERNFTSIQSIADELNSLKLLNPTKQNELYNKFSSLLIKSEYEILTKFDKKTSNLINTEGILIIKSERINFNNKEIESQTLKNSFNSSKLAQEGIITTGHNNLIAITYSKSNSARLIYDLSGNTGVNLSIKIGLYCLVNSPQGYVNYPCIYLLDPLSKAGLSSNGCTEKPSMSIPSGHGTHHITSSNRDAWGCTDYLGLVYLKVGGEFLVPIAGTNNFLTVEKDLTSY